MVEEENNRLSEERKSPARVIKSPKKKLTCGSPEKNIKEDPNLPSSPKKKLAWGSSAKNLPIKEDPDLPPLDAESQTKKSRKAAMPKKVISQPK